MGSGDNHLVPRFYVDLILHVGVGLNVPLKFRLNGLVFPPIFYALSDTRKEIWISTNQKA